MILARQGEAVDPLRPIFPDDRKAGIQIDPALDGILIPGDPKTDIIIILQIAVKEIEGLPEMKDRERMESIRFHLLLIPSGLNRIIDIIQIDIKPILQALRFQEGHIFFQGDRDPGCPGRVSPAIDE